MIGRLRAGSPLLTNLALVLLGALLLGLSRHLAVEFDHFVYGYSETSMFAMAAALGAAWVVSTQPVDRYTFWLIVVFAVLCRLSLLTPEPYLSSDIYRYVWDGMVQHHGVNPYRYFPGNDHLKAFRDDDIFPNINRRDYAPTIYPPVAQLFFFLVTWISATLTMMKLAMGAMEALTVFALVRLLTALGRRREEVILYAWSPLCIWEFGSSGHLDAAVIAMVCLALLFRWRNWPVLTGLALGAAIMFKFYPLVLFPALWRRPEGKPDWKMPATVAAVIAAGYAVYAGVGMKVFGFAGGYVAEEGMDSGSRYFLFDLAHRAPGLHRLPIAAYFVFCTLCFLPVLRWCWRNSALPTGTSLAERARFLRLAAALAFLMMLLFSPHYPWYVAWLLPFILLASSLPMLVYTYSVWWWLTTAYSMPGPGLFYANKWIYGATAATALLAYAWHRFQPRHLRHA